MIEYKFSNEEIEILKFVKTNNPKRIWNNPLQYIFDYEDYYIKLEIECAEKFSIDEFQERYIMFIKVEHVNDHFQPGGSILLSSNEKILNIDIIRTLLFFTKLKQVKSNYFINESSQINPNLNIDKTLKIERKCIVDVGLIITLENKFINCFIANNDDDFDSSDFLYQSIDLKKEKKESYEFIPI